MTTLTAEEKASPTIGAVKERALDLMTVGEIMADIQGQDLQVPISWLAWFGEYVSKLSGEMDEIIDLMGLAQRSAEREAMRSAGEAAP